MQSNESAPSTAARGAYQTPTITRFGTFREITRQGFVGNVDGGLILGTDGTTTPAAEERMVGGSR